MDNISKFEPGSRMIIDAIMLALTVLIPENGTGVVILPELKVGSGDEVRAVNPKSGHEVWLESSIDYVVVEFEDVNDHRRELTSS